MPEAANLTERQAKWFASVREGLERDTGRSLSEWVAIARTCPETAHRARLKWFKDAHGLLQNRASYVLSETFGTEMGWDSPGALVDALWSDPAGRSIYAAVDAAALALPGALRTVRKSYVAWSRKVQFAALRPVRGGTAMLGLGVGPDLSPRLEAPRNESWSERLKARVALAAPCEVDTAITTLLRSAWERA
jgi:hypothetical protein